MRAGRQLRGAAGVAALLAGLVAGSGCDGCGGGAGRLGDDTTIDLELGPLPEEIPLPGAVYRQAYEKAESEITAENARDRLRQIERTIARERRELP